MIGWTARALAGAIRDRLAAGSRFVAMEIDAELVVQLRHALPRLEVFHGDAAHACVLCSMALASASGQWTS